MTCRPCLRCRLALAAVLVPVLLTRAAVAPAADAPPIRAQAVVDLNFDEPNGLAGDAAAAGAMKDQGTLINGAIRVKSPFPGQTGKQALLLDADRKQFVQLADSPDLDRPDAVTIGFFFANLTPAADAAYHGIFAKRDDSKQIANYGLNFSSNGDVLQWYVNDGSGFKVATYSLNGVVGRRRPVYLTFVLQVGDAPAPDADTDDDDVLLRVYANGQPVKPKAATGGMVQELDVWLTDVKVAQLVNDVPLTLGASTPAIEHTSCLVDEFVLFSKALSAADIATLFTEVAGPAGGKAPAEEAPPASPAPEITALSLHGLTRGQTTVLTVTGSHLLPDPVVVTSAPIEKQVVRPGATAERVEFEITIPANAPTGHFPLRVQTQHGLSSAQAVAVDSLPQVPFAESSVEKPVTLPIAISGTLTGQQQAKVFFAGKAGQRLVVDLECRRLGSAMDPVLELKNPRGAPLNIVWARPQFRGDARIEAHLFTDGIYTVELHDLAYKAPGQNSFRLKMGDLKLIDTVFPPGAAAGTQRNVAATGAAGSPNLTLPVDLQQQVPGTARGLLLPADSGVVAPAPIVVASGAVEVLEEPQAEGKLQTVDARFAERAHVPVVINGRISQNGEVDKYLLQVTPGLTMNLAADSFNLRSPLDPHLEVRTHPDGALVAVSEEKPVADVAIPAGVTAVQVAVRDLNRRGSADAVYRLRVTRAGGPDFSLALTAERVTLPRVGSALVRVDVARNGYDGPIALALTGSPEISLTPREIPAGAVSAFVVLTSRSTDPAPGVLVRHLQLTGTSAGLEPAIVRAAQVPADARMLLVPGARQDLVCTLVTAVPAALELGTLPGVWFRGVDSDIPVQLKLQAPELQTRAVRLTLVTTEAPRTVVDPADPTQQRRLPLPLVRSLPEQYLVSGETAGTVRVAVPLEVAEGQIDAVIRADFIAHPLSETILSTVYSPPFRLPVQNPVAVTLAAKNLALTGNAPVKFSGQVQRTAGFTGSVVASIVNLPAGYTAPAVTLAPEQEAFEIVVSAPAVTAAADLPNIQFRVATATGNLLQKDTPLPTKVTPGQ